MRSLGGDRLSLVASLVDMPSSHESAQVISEAPALVAASTSYAKAHRTCGDYLPSRRATEVRDYLQRLGFNVELDTGAQQIGNTCGVVAAWVAVELKLAHLDQPNSWVTTNLAERFDPHVYCMSNLAIGLDADDSTSFISGVKTIRAAQEHWALAMASRGQANADVMEWLSQPETLDFAIRQIVTDLHDVAAGRSESIDLRIRVSNTDDCRSTGTHWFTVAYSIQIVNDDAAAWDAVHATITANLTPVTDQEVQHEDQTAREFYGAPGQAENESLGMHTHGENTTIGTAFPSAPQRLNEEDCMLFVQRAVEDCIAQRSHNTREILFDEITATISRLLVEDGYIGLKDTEFVDVSEHLTSLWQKHSFPNWMLDSRTFNIHEL